MLQKERGRLNYQIYGYVLHQKKERENESKHKRKVANIILLLWSPKIVTSISTSDFRSANQVTNFATRATIVYDFSSFPKLL